jgi:LemA protein
VNGLIVIVVIAVATVALVSWVALLHNGLVRARNHVDNAWSQIQVQLERRHHLIPNLVETVKGYAAHERGVLEAVTKARADAIGAEGPVRQVQAENRLSDVLKHLFAVAEAYPELKANKGFVELQRELSNTEDRAAYARQYYNDEVLTYNNACQTFPRNVIARRFGFRPRDFFETTGDQRGCWWPRCRQRCGRSTYCCARRWTSGHGGASPAGCCGCEAGAGCATGPAPATS